MLQRCNSHLIHMYFLLDLPYRKSGSPMCPPACMSISGPLFFQACTPRTAPHQLVRQPACPYIATCGPLATLLNKSHWEHGLSRFAGLYQKYHLPDLCQSLTKTPLSGKDTSSKFQGSPAVCFSLPCATERMSPQYARQRATLKTALWERFPVSGSLTLQSLSPTGITMTFARLPWAPHQTTSSWSLWFLSTG